MKSFITELGKVIKLDTTKRDDSEQNFNPNKKRLLIPLYQREYKWSSEKVETLLREIKERDKFFGLIILNEKDEHYEIVDGQQRLTTCLLTFVSLFNSYKGQPREQERLLPFIKRNTGLAIENESVGDYLNFDDNEKIVLDIKAEKDVYFQKEDFERIFEIVDNFIKSIKDVPARKDFREKLIDSKLLVLINDSDGNIRSIEQMFLDINEKTQKLDRENIFKGHCFNIYKEEGYEDLKGKWIHLKRVAMKFSKLFDYKDMGQYLYLYLLKDEDIPENMAPKGEHYLKGKTIDETEELLDSMITYGENLIAFDQNIHNDQYCFGDFSEDCYTHRNDNRDIWCMKEMSKNILEFKGVLNQKFPFMHFISNKNKYKNAITHNELKKIICNLYIYSNLFIWRTGKKSKKDIDRTVIQEMQKEQVCIPDIIAAAKALRKAEVEEYKLFETDKFDAHAFIYSIIDFYDRENNFLKNIYSKEQNYNREHFVVPEKSNAIVDWVVEWTTNGQGKCVPVVVKIQLNAERAKRYCKKTTNYLIIDKDLNGSLKAYDILEKIEKIQKWHEARKQKLPQHINLYFEYIQGMECYEKLKQLKENKEQDADVIQMVYQEFVDKFFDSMEINEKITKAFTSVFG